MISPRNFKNMSLLGFCFQMQYSAKYVSHMSFLAPFLVCCSTNKISYLDRSILIGHSNFRLLQDCYIERFANQLNFRFARKLRLTKCSRPKFLLKWLKLHVQGLMRQRVRGLFFALSDDGQIYCCLTFLALH